MTTPAITARPRLRLPPLFVVATAATLIAVGLLVAAALWLDDGHLVYVTDDPGIHLSIVNNVVHHGTWGVVPGRFESASSSPGWTLLLAAFTVVVPPLSNALPLILNVAAGIWLIWVFITNQRLVDVRDRSWSALALAVVLGVVVLYIPALALLGMEHTLQCALVLYAFVLFERLQRRDLKTRALLPLIGIIFLASLVRFESAFVAAGFGVAFFVGLVPRLSDQETQSHWTGRTSVRAAVLVGLAGLAPIVGMGLVNWSFGHGFLPNSIVSKSAAAGHPGLSKLLPTPLNVGLQLQRDPLVLVCTIIVATYLIWAWCGGPRRNSMTAAAFLVAVVMHARLADFGWFARYQEYLVVVGVYLIFQILADIVPAQFRTAAKVSLVIALLALSVARIDLTRSAPRASSNTYRQRYQIGKFYETEYANQAVASSELGYPSLLHHGPFVDVLGLGNHEFLKLVTNFEFTPTRLGHALDSRHAKVLAVFDDYPAVPRGWVKVASWLLNEQLVPGPKGGVINFFAPKGADALELQRKLQDFAPQLPSRVVTLYARLPAPAG